jgi:ABC-type transporter MlaC component
MFRTSFVLAILLFGGLGNASAKNVSESNRAVAQQAKEFVESLGNRALEIINDPQMNDEKAMEEFAKLLKSNFATDSMANFCLGRHAKTLGKEQKEIFLRCFINMLVKLYASNFKEYKTAKFRVVGAKEKAKSQYLVETKVEIPGKNDVAIVWSVRRQKSGEFKIRDATMDEVSVAQIQRAEIGGGISQKGEKEFMSEFRKKYEK